MMYLVAVCWTQIDSTSEDQYIGPFLSSKDATEWAEQIIGPPEGTPWSIQSVDSPTSCVKQFQNGELQ